MGFVGAWKFLSIILQIGRADGANDEQDRLLGVKTMNPKLANRIGWRMIIWGIVIAAVGILSATKGHFTVTTNGVREVITSKDHPGIFWGTSLPFVFIGGALCIGGVYLCRRK
jgi:hypothetical protein